jgi:hypothetical protein
VIGVRNFSRKQGFAPHSAIDSSAIQADYAASESEEPKNRSYAPRSQEEDRNGKMQNSDAFNKRLKDSASGNGSGKTWEEIDNEIRDNERKELLRQAGLNEQGKPIEDEEV